MTMLRLSPLFPMAIISWVLGITDMGMFDFALGTFIGLIPPVLAECYIGSQMKAIAEEGADFNLVVTIVLTVVSVVVISYWANSVIQQI